MQPGTEGVSWKDCATEACFLILDIRPVSLLRKEERESRELLILGIARGYGEAAEVVRSMIDDMYQKTGAFNWTAYMESLPKICGTEVDSRK